MALINKKLPIFKLTRQFSTVKALAFDSEEDFKNYQYLHESQVPSNKFLSSLPRLPIPKLNNTCDRYLASQKPLLDSNDYATTKLYVDEFRESGKILDTQLRALDKSNKHTSYINQPWTDMYLLDRRSVAFNHNPGIKFIDDPDPKKMHTDLRAANILISSLRFHSSYRNNILKPDVFHMKPSKTNNDSYWNRVKYFPDLIATPLSYLFKVFPLDMYQHPNLLQSSRIAKKQRDLVQRFPDSKHILVMRKGHFYTFPCYDDEWNIYPPAYYVKCFQNILLDKAPKSSEIGVMTSQDRDSWADIRNHLEENLGNKEALEKIDSAIYCINLDDHWKTENEDEIDTIRNLVTGFDPTNRWFDKSFSVMFSANGAAGINFEHAWGDGVAVMRFINEVVEDSEKNDFVTNSGEWNHDIHVERIHINTDEKIQNAVEKAKINYMKKFESVTFDLVMHHGMGKEDFKTMKVGPDSFMQASFIIAYHRLFNKIPSTYESCSTAIFKNGRTEAMRPCTLEVAHLAKALNGKTKSKEEILKMFQTCSAKHLNMIKLAAQGQGWDRHLFALKNLLKDKPFEELPMIFQDKSYANINHNIISTSTLGTYNVAAGGFCPVVSDGFGFGYQMRKDDLGAYVSSYKDYTNGKDMADSLKSVFQDLSNLVK